MCAKRAYTVPYSTTQQNGGSYGYCHYLVAFLSKETLTRMLLCAMIFLGLF
jgi:hypothetical protein